VSDIGSGLSLLSLFPRPSETPPAAVSQHALGELPTAAHW